MKPYWRASLLLLLVPFVAQPGASQTDPEGNYEIYTREISQSAPGYLTTRILFSGLEGGLSVRQNGLMYMRSYEMGNLGHMVIGNSSEIRVMLKGSFRIGLAMSTTELSATVPPLQSPVLRFYLATLDVFSMDLVSSYTYAFNGGNAIGIDGGVTILNIGATGGMAEKTSPKQTGMAYAGIIPVAFRASLVMDFGRRGVGVGIYYNPYNLLAYKYVREPLFAADETGIWWSDSTLKRFSVQAVFTF